MQKGIAQHFDDVLVGGGILALDRQLDMLAHLARHVAHQTGKRSNTSETGSMRTAMMAPCISCARRSMTRKVLDLTAHLARAVNLFGPFGKKGRLFFDTTNSPMRFIRASTLA